jgi:hypothetical protein
MVTKRTTIGRPRNPPISLAMALQWLTMHYTADRDKRLDARTELYLALGVKPWETTPDEIGTKRPADPTPQWVRAANLRDALDRAVIHYEATGALEIIESNNYRTK